MVKKDTHCIKTGKPRVFTPNDVLIRGEIAEVVINVRSGDRVVAIIDKRDVERVVSFGRWILVKGTNTVYAQSRYWYKGKLNYISLHRFINKPTDDLEVDHKNRNGLDCRRKNLQTVTRTLNMQNRACRSSTGEKNVYKSHGSYIVHIVVNKKRIVIGCYRDIEKAKEAARSARIEFHTNCPENIK